MNISEVLHSMDGEHKNPLNACQYCDADVEIKNVEGRMFSMEIKHDDDCPLWILIQATRES